jgi:acyl-coenzyme A thioesterase PaaI-like protein
MLQSYVGLSTVDLSIRMLKAVPKGKELLAEGKVTHVSKWLVFQREYSKMQMALSTLRLAQYA